LRVFLSIRPTAISSRSSDLVFSSASNLASLPW
jgi:hypothetical protein